MSTTAAAHPVSAAAHAALPLALLGLAALVFRIPPFLNAAGVHSDAAIVGLQAEHILRGELSRFLWGAGYQGSGDAFAVAAAFAVFGATPRVLMAVPFVGYLVVLGVSWSMLRSRIGPWSAAVACLPLVFAPQALNGVILYAPRQGCITAVALGLWLIDGAPRTRVAELRLGAGVALVLAAVWLDLYALLLLPAALAFAAATLLDAAPNPRRRLALGGVSGLAVGAVLLAVLRHGASAAQAHLTLARLRPNLSLLVETCLPWLLGMKVFIPDQIPPRLWNPPSPVAGLQTLAGASLLLGIAWTCVELVRRTLPWNVLRLGLLGVLATATALVAFPLSGMPADPWSARYLAPIVWTAPFALAPVVLRLGSARRALAVLAPYLVVAAVGGWLGYGTYVDGPWPRRDARGMAEDEAELGRALRSRGVDAAAAQYWLSYRLTFLWGEDPIVVPANAGEDRYPPYRRFVATTRTLAWIVHPSEPRLTPAQLESLFRGRATPVTQLSVRGFTVFLEPRVPLPTQP